MKTKSKEPACSHILCLLCIVFGFHTAFTQTDTICLRGNWLRGHSYGIGTCTTVKRIPSIIRSESALYQKLKNSVPAKESLQLSNKLSIYGHVSSITAAGFVAFMFLAKRNASEELNPKIFIPALIPLTMALVFDYTSTHRLRLSISYYNNSLKALDE